MLASARTACEITGMHRLITLFVFLVPLRAAEKLVIISPHNEHIQREYGTAFTEHYTRNTGNGIEIQWLDQGGTSDDFRFIASEFSRTPQGIGVDIFWGGGTDPYVRLKEQGRLAPYALPDSIAAGVAARACGVPVSDAGNAWHGAALSGFGILRNRVVTDMMKLPEVAAWDDLARPELFTWIGSADPRSSGSAHMCYEIIMQAYGWEKGWSILTRLGANVKTFSKGASQTPKDVAVGEVAFGLVIDLYAWAQIQEVGRDRLDYVLPAGLTVINPDAVAILKGAPNRTAAEAFVNFVMSDAGQALLLLPPTHPDGPREHLLGRMAVRPALYDRYRDDRIIKLNPFTYTESFAYDAAAGSARWGILNDLIGIYLIDLHDELAAAWERIIEHGCPPEYMERLAALPVTEAEFAELAGKWRDQQLRNRTLVQWTEHALKKYRGILRELK